MQQTIEITSEGSVEEDGVKRRKIYKIHDRMARNVVLQHEQTRLDVTDEQDAKISKSLAKEKIHCRARSTREVANTQRRRCCYLSAT